MNSKFIYIFSIIAVVALSGCGGESSGFNDNGYSDNSSSLKSNNKPVARNFSVDTIENSKDFKFKLNASDEDGDSLSYTVTKKPEHGSVRVVDDIAYYTPNQGYIGRDSFEYMVSDGKDSDRGKVVIDVKDNPILDLSGNGISLYDLSRFSTSQLKNLKLNLGNKEKSLYILFTSDSSYSNPNVVSAEPYDRYVSSSSKDNSSFHKTPQKVLDFRNKAYALLKKKGAVKSSQFSLKKRVLANQYDEARFCIDINSDNSCASYIDTVAKRVVEGVDTKQGKKNLVVWVEKGNSISQDKVDRLADIFLRDGANNDIYDWETNVYGGEWGSDASAINSNLANSDDTVNILIYDMNSLGLAGYFWSKDNYKQSIIGASNERIMFYINSELLKADEKETYTTLVHEFQHMIHFYQRGVKLGLQDSTWYDEMMSEATEDLIATKIGYMGPRNVDPSIGDAGEAGNSGGRYPGFNYNNTISLTNWSNSIDDYSKVSSFGAYLLRNYDGAKILHNLMYSNASDESALKNATGAKRLSDLVRNWGAAVVLSDKVNIDASQKVSYNFGDFKESSYNGITYKLGSINFYNYNPEPQFKSSASLEKNSNLYYKVGDNLSGKIKIDIDSGGAKVLLIAK